MILEIGVVLGNGKRVDNKVVVEKDFNLFNLCLRVAAVTGADV